MAYYEIFNSPIKAIEVEKKLKGWTKAKKKALIESNWSALKELAECKNETNYLKANAHTSTPLSVTPCTEKYNNEENINNWQ